MKFQWIIHYFMLNNKEVVSIWKFSDTAVVKNVSFKHRYVFYPTLLLFAYYLCIQYVWFKNLLLKESNGLLGWYEQSPRKTNWNWFYAIASARKTSVLYETASNDVVAKGSNEAKVNARRTSPKSHIGKGEGFGSLLLWNRLHSLNSVPNCAGVKFVSAREQTK